MTTLSPYLFFKGNCEEAFIFYKKVFGGEIISMNKYKDLPPSEGKTCSPEDEHKIMHISLAITKETVLMGSDMVESMGHQFISGNNFSISLNTESEDEAKRIYKELSSDGNVIMLLEKTFWGALYGMFTDKFGIGWMVNYDENQHK